MQGLLGVVGRVSDTNLRGIGLIDKIHNRHSWKVLRTEPYYRKHHAYRVFRLCSISEVPVTSLNKKMRAVVSILITIGCFFVAYSLSKNVIHP